MSLKSRLYEAQVKKDTKTVEKWNRQLEEEIAKKEGEAGNDSLSG
jgi:transposase-like protein